MHPQLIIDGQAVSLDHLKPIRHRVNLTLRGNVTKTVDVEFHFSNHCYSRGLSDGEEAPVGYVIPDGSVHKPRPRAFDWERYELSKRLVGLLGQLIEENGLVSKTHYDNFYRVDQVETLRDGSTKTVSYFIFMHARKVSEPNRPKMIRVQVESAYPEQDGIPHPQGQGSRSFGAMLGEKWV